jgi:hypothetical protein
MFTYDDASPLSELLSQDKVENHPEPGTHVFLDPLQEGQDGVGGRQSLVGGRLGQVVAHDPEGEGHALQRVNGVLVGDVVAGEKYPDSENPSDLMRRLHVRFVRPILKSNVTKRKTQLQCNTLANVIGDI